MALTSRESRKWAIIGIALLIAFIALLWRLSATLTPIFLAFGLAYAFTPLVAALEKRGVPRTLTVISVLLALFGSVAVLFATVIPALASELQGFVSGFPDFLSTALDRVADFAARFGVQLPVNRDQLVDRLRSAIGDTSVEALSPVVLYGKRVLSGAGAVAAALFNVFIVPVFFFFFLRDFPKTKRFVYEVIPERQRPTARSLFGRIDNVLAGYIRGQVLVALILGVVFSLALTFLGIKFGLVIGFVAGLLNLVPFLGQFVGFFLAMIMALVDFDGTWKLLAIPILFLVTNFLEGNLIAPKIVGDRVGIPPVWAIIAVIVATQLIGFWGLVIGVPVAGCLKVIFAELLHRYRRSPVYRAGEGEEERARVR